MKNARIYIAIILTLFFVFCAHVLAQAEYKLASPLPGGGDAIPSTGNPIITYMEYLFPFLLSVAAIAALIQLIIGGIQYTASAGNPSLISNAKNRMTQALLGLILAGLSVLILRLINPNLVRLHLDLKGAGLGSPHQPPAGVQSDIKLCNVPPGTDGNCPGDNMVCMRQPGYTNYSCVPMQIYGSSTTIPEGCSETCDVSEKKFCAEQADTHCWRCAQFVTPKNRNGIQCGI